MICPSLVAPLFAAVAPAAALPLPLPPPAARPPIAVPQRSGKKSKATPKVIYYGGEWEAAQKDALERNVPILTIAMLDEDDENARDDDGEFREFLRTDVAMARATGEVLFVLANPSTHPLETIKVKNEEGKRVEREVCSFFHSDGCSPHKRNFDLFYQARATFEGTRGRWDLPEFVLTDPQGRDIWRKADGHYAQAKKLLTMIAQAVKTSGPGITSEQLKEVRTLCADSHAAAERGDTGAAWRAYASVLAITETGPLGLEAKTGADEALAVMQERVERASVLVVPATARLGYEQLLKLDTEYAGTPVAKNVRRAIKAAEKRGDVKEIVRAYKAELEARALWEELLAAQQSGKAAKAQALAKKLMAEKYAQTAEAKKAREKYPDLE